MPTAATVREIASLDHPLVKEVRRALSKGELLAGGDFAGTLALDSPHLVEEAAAAGLTIAALLLDEDAAMPAEPLGAGDDPAAVRPARAGETAFYRLSRAAFKKMASTDSPQGVIALVRPREWAAHELFDPAPALVAILAGIQDPGNAGTLLRSAEAFGATGALLLRGTVHAANPKFLRGASGSTFRLPHLASVQLDQALVMCAANNATVLALDPRATETLDDVDLRGPIAIAIGAEGMGLPPDLLDNARAVSIPRVRRVESLNAAVAGSLAFAEAARQRAA